MRSNLCKCRDKSNPMLLNCKFKGHYLPPCVPPLLAPLTLPFKNFNRATFTTYYIKKAAAKFTLNGVLLMLNVHLCYVKIFLSIYRVCYNFVIRKNYRAAPKLKKVEKHCSRPVLRYFFEPAAHFENF